MLSESVKESWKINTRINLNLLGHLSSDMLVAQSSGSGHTVAQHLVHMIDALKFWGQLFDKPRFSTIPDLADPRVEAIVPIADLDLATLRKVMEESRDLALEAADVDKDKGKLPYHSIETFLIHIIAHDSHHRGQIVLALKAGGHLLPEDSAIWSPWRIG